MIRKSTAADLLAIRSWLEAEKAQGVDGNFLCNWFVIESSHEDGRLLVYVDGASGVPVAFQLGGLHSPGILQVRNDMRRTGIGSKLVKHRIEQAYEKDECLLLIQCTPSSSVRFWRAMGFKLLPGEPDKRRAYRILPKKHQLPPGGRKVRAKISFRLETRNFDKPALRIAAATPAAVVTPDDVVHLGRRVFCFTERYPEAGDAFVEISVNGQLRYNGKAKYAESIGVRRCKNGFYIDRISSFQWTAPTGRFIPAQGNALGDGGRKSKP